MRYLGVLQEHYGRTPAMPYALTVVLEVRRPPTPALSPRITSPTLTVVLEVSRLPRARPLLTSSPRSATYLPHHHRHGSRADCGTLADKKIQKIITCPKNIPHKSNKSILAHGYPHKSKNIDVGLTG